MTYLLVANTVFEGLFALLMIVSPATVLKGCTGLAAAMAGSFGFAELAIAALSLGMVVRPEAASSAGLLALAVFHIGLTISLARGAAKRFNPVPPVALHAMFSVAFVIALAAR
jgi:hypothetical protein